MEQKRNQLLDVAKGVAIILVVWAHALQQYSGLDNHTALNLWIERFLISFYMPLFALISGYLFYFSLQRHTEKSILRSRLAMFALPIITMSVIHFLRYNLTHLNFEVVYNHYPLTLVNTLWFFWAMIIITLLMCMVHRWLKDSIIGYIAVISITLMLPNEYPLRAYVYLYPTFVTAYLFAKYKEKISAWGGGNYIRQIIQLTLLMALFVLMLRHFDYDDMIYFSRYSLLGSTDLMADLTRDILRFGIGLVGSLMVLQFIHICLITKVLNNHIVLWLSSIGNITFGIYVFQDLLLLILSPFSKYLNADYYMTNAVVFFVVIFTLSVYLTRYAQNHRFMSITFLGKI